MTTDAIQLLRDHWSDVPDADEETMRRAYAYATSTRTPGWRDPIRRFHFAVPRLRLRIAIPVVAAVALATGLSLAFIPQSSRTRSAGSNALQGLMLTPDSGAIGPGSSLNVSLDYQPVPDASASLELRVLREAFPPGADRNTFDPASEPKQVVFKETVPMDVRPITVTAPGDDAYLASWSGTLSVSDWTGGCQSNSIYFITALVLDSKGVPAGSSGSNWLTCRG